MKARNPYRMVWALLLGAATASAQVELTDNLAVSGFVDAAYTNTDDGSTSSESISVDEVEVDLLFNLNTVSGEVHLQSTGDTLELEQAFVTYDLGNGLTLNAGRYLSLLGFESDESVTRFTRSLAYDLANPLPISLDNNGSLRAYNDGVKLEAVTEQGWLAVSLVDEVWTDYGPGNINEGALGLELQAGFTGQNGFTAVIGYGGQDTGEGTPNAELYNIWVSYETGALTLAAEYNDYENAGAAGNSGDSLMGLARYALNEKSSITGRYSEENLNDGRATEKWTIAPTYSFSDNLAGRIEYSRTEYTGVANMDEVELFAVEAMFTF